MLKIDKLFIASILVAGMLGSTSSTIRAAVRIERQVQAGGRPLANSAVTLWAASSGQPQQLAQARTGSDGRFDLGSQETLGPEVILYVVARGNDNTVALLSVLGNEPPAKIVINELTTVASTFTSARFIKGEAISGNCRERSELG